MTEHSQENVTQESSHPSSSFLKKAIFINIVILGIAVISVVFIVRHLVPMQAVHILNTTLETLKKRITETEMTLKLHETSLKELTQKLDALSKQQPQAQQQTQAIETRYQDLLHEFKLLMENQKSSEISVPFFKEGKLFQWFSNQIHIQKIPHHTTYAHAYELMKQGNLNQAINLLRPLADPSVPLSLWLDKAVALQNSLLKD